LKGGRALDLKTVPPQEALHQPVIDFYPYGRDAGILVDLMDQAHGMLANHDINTVRVDLGENPADRIWLWGEGVDFELPPFESYFSLEGCIISAVPLLKGIAHKIGFHHVAVPGATGYVDTDYEAKARAGLNALSQYDLVIVHVGAVNEICHQGDPEAKVKAIEAVDRRLVGPILEGMGDFAPWRLMVASDHMSPAEDPAPLKWPVPVAFCGHEVTAVREYPFTEESAKKSDLFIERGPELMEFFLNIRREK
jgi:2,3-bisphosphoglycerate-independent phosphoglycerate mutase